MFQQELYCGEYWFFVPDRLLYESVKDLFLLKGGDKYTWPSESQKRCEDFQTYRCKKQSREPW